MSTGEAGREAESHIHLSTQQAFPGAFQGTVCLRAGPAALPEPPSSPKDTVASLGQTPSSKKMKPCLRRVFSEQLRVYPDTKHKGEWHGCCLKLPRTWEAQMDK